ncbi:hypothetical protein F-VV57_0194 [Faustovirus]|nr:hypothetical protein F-VV57_0194 [Faustovirus]QJX73461.1 hypothetical protein F-VV63_0195 [Faustovirus]
MNILPDDAICEIILAAYSTYMGDILIIKCLSMTSRRILAISRYIQAHLGNVSRINEYDTEPQWRSIGLHLVNDNITTYSTRYIIGICGLNDGVITGIMACLNAEIICGKRLFSALIKSRICRIKDLNVAIKYSWILWAIRKIGIDDIYDMEAVIRLNNADLLHEAIAHSSQDAIKTHLSCCLHYVVARCVNGSTSLHKALVDAMIVPTVTDLVQSFVAAKYQSAAWIYQWLVLVGNHRAHELRNEMYRGRIESSTTKQRSGLGIRVLIDIQIITISSDFDMIEFICRYLSLTELIAFIDNRNISILNVNVGQLIDNLNGAKSHSCDRSAILEYLNRINSNSAEREAFSDSDGE